MNSIVLKMSAAAIAGSMMLSVAACSSDVGPNEAGGTAVGAVAGAAIGSAFGSGSGKLAAIGVGALFGGLLGHEIGKQMDERDRQRALQAQAMAYTAPVGTKVVWTNPDNGHSGSVVPVRDSTDANGNYCREFQETVTIGGQPQQAYGQACRQPDGSWKVVQ
ncbi:MAG TPA: RT0821/Lpp0805 family surface protein [Magnetospirillaceae bacterium]